MWNKERTRRRWAILIIAAALVLLSAPYPAEGRSKNKGGATLRAKRSLRSARSVRSPDRRHRATRARRGVYLDGRLVWAGRALTPPVWRRDSRAFAFIQRVSSFQLAIVVIDRRDPPLVWTLPPLIGRRPHLFWLGRRSVGVGNAPLVPRVVVSWSTGTAHTS